jgi:hypothetical protein
VAILELLDARAAGATICPSEAARQVAAADPEGGPPTLRSSRAPAGAGEAWRELLEPARRAARRLVARGEVELTQRGRVVDPSTFRGPVRIRRTATR